MIELLPSWYLEAEKILEEAVNKISAKNHINFYAVDDSKSISVAKRTILNSLVWIYEKVDIEERLMLEKFSEKIKKNKKK